MASFPVILRGGGGKFILGLEDPLARVAFYGHMYIYIVEQQSSSSALPSPALSLPHSPALLFTFPSSYSCPVRSYTTSTLSIQIASCPSIILDHELAFAPAHTHTHTHRQNKKYVYILLVDLKNLTSQL